MNKTPNESIIRTICLTIIPITLVIPLLVLYQTVSILAFALIATGLAIGSILYAVYCFHNTNVVPTCISCMATLICVFAVIYSIITFSTAQSHGMYTNDMPFPKVELSIKNSPVEDTIPDDLDGSIIIYYRFGCIDCEAIYDDLSEIISGKDDIYWVSTESEQGKELMKTYPVDSVPSGIYIYNDKQNGNTYVKKPLYKTSENAKNHEDTIYSNGTILDKTAIDRLLYLQEQK